MAFQKHLFFGMQVHIRSGNHVIKDWDLSSTEERLEHSYRVKTFPLYPKVLHLFSEQYFTQGM
jgi:hypothetical protein